MRPIYKFTLSDGTNTQQAFPVYKDDLAIEYALESNQQFYRGKLSGKLTFQRDDYTLILNAAFDTRFDVVISISYDAGATWAAYWSGQFWKTDCEFDEDNQTVVVTPTVNDQYNDILAGLDKEYDLIQLAPAMESVSLDKRPMIQVYVPGQTVIGCFLSGMWWEQECEAVEETDMVEIEGGNYPALTHKYFFALNNSYTYIRISGSTSPLLPLSTWAPYQGKYFDFTVGGYRYARTRGTIYDTVAIADAGTGTVLWWNNNVDHDLETVYQVTLTPPEGSPSVGDAVLDIDTRNYYARYITDVEAVGSTTSHPIPEDDLVDNNRNYKRVRPYYSPNTIVFNDQLSATPTEWGLYQSGMYYQMFVSPSGGIYESYPISRATWGAISAWFVFDAFDWTTEQAWRKEYTLKDAYPIWSVISVLLAKVAPGISHLGTTDYSAFLYGVNPLIKTVNQRLFITPKSNLIASGYDQPAQKAPITLKGVLDMLRDCFRLYWFIDGDGKLCIEHVSYFMKGGSYDREPTVDINLTQQTVTRNGKPWSYARNQYKFDKPDMAARYQFGWMDDVTEYFEGFPIDIVSRYVNPDNIEQVEVQQFTSDVDYILLNPSAISKDGFVLLAARNSGGSYKLPYVNFSINNSDHILQNAWVSFMFLQNYYKYDMPARQYAINGTQYTALGIKKLKTQTIKFPLLTEPDLKQLIKTELGDGVIEKLTLNLSARAATATLKYDTE